MKILLITYEYPPIGGGTGKVVMNTARQMRALGHEPAILTARYGEQPREFRTTSGIPILRIPVLRRHPHQANAIEVMSFAASGVWNAGGILEWFRPEVCLAYFTLPSGLVARELKRRAGIPYHTMLLGQDVPGHPETGRLLQAAARPALLNVWRNSDKLIANSRALADLARKTAGAREIEAVWNGVDLDLFSPGEDGEPRDPDRAGGIEGNGEVGGDGGVGKDGYVASVAASAPFRILYVGRLTRQKRVRELIAGFAAARRANPGAPMELRVAGLGPDRPALETLIHEHRLSGIATLLGRIDEARVVAEMRAADLFVNPSEAEGLPAAVLEAMACGVPPLLSDIPPHREIAREGTEALFCGRATAPEIAAGIAAALAMPAAPRAALAAAARRVVEERFGWRAATEHLLGII